MRLGIRLNPIKARIFDALKRAGPDGIETEMLFDLIYAGRPTQRTTLKSQIWQLNALLREAETGLRIRGDRGGDPTSSRCFRMVKEKRG
jgi:hypothetical protein